MVEAEKQVVGPGGGRGEVGVVGGAGVGEGVGPRVGRCVGCGVGVGAGVRGGEGAVQTPRTAHKMVLQRHIVPAGRLQ